MIAAAIALALSGWGYLLTPQHVEGLYTLLGWDQQLASQGALVAACEAYHHTDFAGQVWLDPYTIGDGGRALGIMQIHPLWASWAEDLTGQPYHRQRIIDSLALAMLIVTEYEQPRGRAWANWTCSHRLP